MQRATDGRRSKRCIILGAYGCKTIHFERDAPGNLPAKLDRD
jgi:hypothetical protein